MYIDDTFTFSFSSNPRRASRNVPNDVNVIVEYLTKLKIRINAEKNEAFIFRYCKSRYKVVQSPLPISVGCRVAYKDKIKYFVYWLQANLEKNAHGEHSVAKDCAGLRTLYPLLKANSGVSIPLWRNHNRTLYRKLEILENKCIRLAIGFKRSPDRIKYISTKKLHITSKIPYILLHQ